MHVAKVEIDGLNKTKDYLVQRVVAKIFEAKTVWECLEFTKNAHVQLKELGCFHKVNGIIDIEQSDSKALVVNFQVEELPLTFVDASTETGDNEVIGVANVGMPNMIGLGERLQTTWKLGSGGSNEVSLNYKVPIHSNILRRLTNGHCDSSFIASLYRMQQKMTWSSLQATYQGFSMSANLSPKSWLQQLVKYDCSWRHLKASDSPGFAARQVCGHSLKSSLINRFSINTLDDQAIPSQGIKFMLRQELAGLGLGNVAFFKTEVNGSYYHQIGQNFVIGAGGAGGSVSHMMSSDDPCSVRNSLPCDKFTLGGPVLMRGFRHHRLGPVEDGNHLGFDAFWRVSLHGFTKKLPFLRGESWLTNNVCAHAFAEVCQVGNLNGGSYLKWFMGQAAPRASAGMGLIVRLGERGRAELNYSIPLAYHYGDALNRGLQLGIGIVYS